jgi:hypothetical protein
MRVHRRVRDGPRARPRHLVAHRPKGISLKARRRRVGARVGWGESRPARTVTDDRPAEPGERGPPPAAALRPDEGGRSCRGRGRDQRCPLRAPRFPPRAPLASRSERARAAASPARGRRGQEGAQPRAAASRRHSACTTKGGSPLRVGRARSICRVSFLRERRHGRWTTHFFLIKGCTRSRRR